MDCSSCSQTPTFTDNVDDRTIQAAQQLAHVLEVSPEFQEYVRMVQIVNGDEQVTQFLRRIRSLRAYFSQDNGTDSLESLQEQMENLPVMKEYRRAEAQVRDLFLAVERAVSKAAGIDFSANVQASGCG